MLEIHLSTTNLNCYTKEKIGVNASSYTDDKSYAHIEISWADVNLLKMDEFFIRNVIVDKNFELRPFENLRFKETVGTKTDLINLYEFRSSIYHLCFHNF